MSVQIIVEELPKSTQNNSHNCYIILLILFSCNTICEKTLTGTLILLYWYLPKNRYSSLRISNFGTVGNTLIYSELTCTPLKSVHSYRLQKHFQTSISIYILLFFSVLQHKKTTPPTETVNRAVICIKNLTLM